MKSGIMAHSTDQLGPSPDEIDAALESFWQGSADELDRLIERADGEGPAIGAALSGVIGSQWSSLVQSYVIPGYTLVRELGRGGMAIVFEAVQQSTGRGVALKLVPGAGVQRERQARFLRHEVQTLSLLRHDGIATLFDAGETTDKCQYFAMELVRGRPLSQHFAATPVLDHAELRRRLELIVEVCNAVAYAHGRGVIHCDLKPTNVLVDEGGRAKVLDFGLARLLELDPTTSLNLGGNGLMGTLAYMSPEQAAGRASDIDIRSDVYAIGVMLYELLTGRRPYDLTDALLPQAIQRICESRPALPSQSSPMLRGDVDTIVTTALSKEPARRYQSVSALASDIQRYLDSRPIEARPASAFYVLSKWCNRHRLPAALIAVLVVVMIAFAAVEIRQAMQLARQRDEARQHARRADQASAFLRSVFGAIDPNLTGADVSVGTVLDDAASRVDAELSDHPEARAELHATFGNGYHALARFKEAQREFEKASEIWKSLAGESDPRYAAALHMTGMVSIRIRDHIDVYNQIKRAYGIRQTLFTGDHPDLAESLHGLGVIHQFVDFPAAESYFRQSLDMRRRLFGEHALVAESLDSLGRMMVNSGRFTEGEPLLMQALEMRKRRPGPDSTVVAQTLGLLADVHLQNGFADSAVREYREQIRIFTRMFGEKGSTYLAHALSDLAVALFELGEFAEAEEINRKAVAMETRCRENGAAELTRHNYAFFLRSLGRYDEAEALALEVDKAWGSSSAGRPNTGTAYAAMSLGAIYLETGRLEKAEARFNEADRVWIGLLGPESSKRSPTLLAQAQLAEERGDLRSAEDKLRTAIRLISTSRDDAHPDAAFARMRLGRILFRSGKVEEGQRMTREAYQEVKTATRAGRMHKQRANLRFAEDLLAWGDLDAAAAQFDEFLAEDGRLNLDRHPMRADALLGKAEIVAARGEQTEAHRLLDEALAIYSFRHCLGESRRRRTAPLADRPSSR